MIKKKFMWVIPVALTVGLCTGLVGCSCSSDEATTQAEEEADNASLTEDDLSYEDDGIQIPEVENETSDDAVDNETVTNEGTDMQQVTAISAEETASTPAGPAYYDTCDEYIVEYGEGACDDTSDYASLTGLCFAGLFDFDGDGENELIVAYASDNAAELSAYSNSHQVLSPHFIVEIWKYVGSSAECIYRGTSIYTSEGSEAVAWGRSQYGAYILSGERGVGSNTWYYNVITGESSTVLAEVTLNDDEELVVNGQVESDDWLDETVFEEHILAGYGMSEECERTLESFNETLTALKGA